MDTVGAITETVADRLLAAYRSYNEFFAVYDQALASFGKEITSNALDRCADSNTPQWQMINGWIIKAVIDARNACSLSPQFVREMDQMLGKVGIPSPPLPKPKLHVIDGDAE
jgi:hypothetical protein